MAEEKKQRDNKTLSEDHASTGKNHYTVDYKEIRGSVVRKDSTVTNTLKSPDPIKKK